MFSMFGKTGVPEEEGPHRPKNAATFSTLWASILRVVFLAGLHATRLPNSESSISN